MHTNSIMLQDRTIVGMSAQSPNWFTFSVHGEKTTFTITMEHYEARAVAERIINALDNEQPKLD